jgi:hypothetical protein
LSSIWGIPRRKVKHERSPLREEIPRSQRLPCVFDPASKTAKVVIPAKQGSKVLLLNHDTTLDRERIPDLLVGTITFFMTFLHTTNNLDTLIVQCSFVSSFGPLWATSKLYHLLRAP